MSQENLKLLALQDSPDVEDVKDVKDVEDGKWKQIFKSNGNIAVLLATLSAIIFGIIDVLVKFLLQTFDVVIIIAFRYLISTLVLSGFVALQPMPDDLIHNLTPKTALLIFGGGFIKCIATILKYSALKYISVLNFAVILNSKIVFVSIIGRIFLKESISWYKMITLVLTLTGVSLVCYSKTDTNSDEGNTIILGGGIVYAITSAFLQAVYSVIVRYTNKIPANYVLWTQNVIGSTFILPFFLMNAIDYEYRLSTVSLLVLISFLALLTRFLETKATQWQSLCTVAIMMSLQVPVSFVAQWLVFGTIPGTIGIIGSSLVLGATLMIAIGLFYNFKSSDS
ncbi:hypothetical protein GQR58_002621 [Nymphon striatum]|nr:hypothetical protein GQR58_002621 [Nymphon striatum]